MWLAFVALSVAAPVWAQAPELEEAASAAARGRLAQVDLPGWEERRSRAEARQAAGQAWFAGTGPLEAAWPELHGAPLTDPTFLAGVQAGLADEAERRASAWVEAVPEGLSEGEQARWSAARAGALEAEAVADEQTRRLVGGLATGVAAHPMLRADALAEARAVLAAERAAAAALSEDAPARPAALVRARVAGEAEASLTELERAVVRALTVPGDQSLDARMAADRALLDGSSEPGLEVDAARDRLTRVASLRPADAAVQASLDEAERKSLVAATADLRATAAEPVTLQGLGAAEEALAVANRELEAAERALTDLAEGEVGTLAAARRDHAVAVRDLATSRLEAVSLRHGELLATSAEVLTDADVAEADEDARQAQRQAEDARARHDDGTAEALARVAALASETTTLLTEERSRQRLVEERLDRYRTRYDHLNIESREARALGPSAPGRQSRIDAAYLDFQHLVREVSLDLATQRAEGRELEVPSEAGRARVAEDREGLELLLSQSPLLEARWDEAVIAYHDVLDTREERFEADLDDLMMVLEGARASRRVLATEASRDALAQARQDFLHELVEETGELPIRARSGLRQAWATVVSFPRTLTDLTALSAVLIGSLELILILAGWLVFRQQIDHGAAVVLTAVHRADPRETTVAARVRQQVDRWFEPGDLREADVELSQFLEHVLDVFAAGAVYWLFADELPVLGLVALFVVWRAVVRGGPELVDLAMAPPDAARPSLRRVSRDRIDKTRDNVRLVLAWRAFVSLGAYVALELLDGDRLGELVAAVGVAMGVVIAVLLLRGWREEVRAALQRDEQTRFVTRLVAPRTNRLVELFVTAVGVGVLLWRVGGRMGQAVISRRAGLAWLGAALARQQLRDARETRTPPLSPQALADIEAAANPVPVAHRAKEALWTGTSAWLKHRSRAMIAVSGDRGMGRQSLLSLVDGVVGGDLPVRHVRLHGRIRSPQAALDWLAGALDLPKPGGDLAEAERARVLIESLRARPAEVVVIDEMHRSIIRAVGGFTALRRLLSVMHAVSDHHLWICGFHGPMWSYLQAVAAAVNLDVFRTHVATPQLDPLVLRTWLGGATKAAGFESSFDNLSAGGPGDPHGRSMERASDAFWRLLTDSCQGNPEVARCFWTDCIGPDPNLAERVNVGLFALPDAVLLEELSDQQRFILTCVIQHDGLGVADVAESLNLPRGAVRATLRQLEAAGVLVLQPVDQHYVVRLRWLPVVERVLRNRSLIHQAHT